MLLMLATEGLAACRQDIVEAMAGDRRIAFRVEIADTPDEQARGLMFRRDLEADAGMLFLFDRAEARAFWMRNTPLPLDMLFVGADGRVCGIAAQAEPFTDEPRRSGCPAIAVLEINGGLAERLGIGIGTALRHPAFGREAAAPCP